MSAQLRLPNINAPTEREQIAQIRSYLYQFIPQLQFILDNIPNDNTSVRVITQKTPSYAVASGRWSSLALSGGITEPVTPVGRTSGCQYMVEAEGKHIYVAFSGGLTYSGSPIQINNELLPEGRRPVRDVHTICAVEGASGERAIARMTVKPTGQVFVDWVHSLSATTPSVIEWIDGYIDYWV